MTDQRLTDRLRSLQLPENATFGVYARSLDGERELDLRGDEVFPTASTVKVFILYTLLENAQRNRVSLSERIRYESRFATPGSGVLIHLDDGLELTIRDVATLMMMISDNSATNLLIDYLGLETINTAIAAIPLPHTRCGDWADFAGPDRESQSLGSSTPREMAQFLIAVRSGELLTQPFNTLFWDTLRIQKYIEPLRRHLPASPWAREWNKPEPVWVASKPGHLIDCTCESGLVHANGREYVISIMSRNLPDADKDPGNTGENLVADVSRLVFEAWAEH